MNSQIKEILGKMYQSGLALRPCTTANKQLILSTTNRNIKVVVDPNDLTVEVMRFGGEEPMVIDSGFYINPYNVAVAADRIKQSLERRPSLWVSNSSRGMATGTYGK
jgi:hypothetical protein